MTAPKHAEPDWTGLSASLDRASDGCLMIEGERADRLAGRLGTPALVVLPARVRANVREITDAFARRLPRVRTYFALKSCYLEPVVSAVLEAGAGLEVMSPLELDIAQAMGIREADLLVNGFGHTPAFAKRAVDQEPALFTLDSFEDIETVSRAARASGTAVSVGLRVSLPTTGPGMLDDDTKLGFTWQDGQFTRALARVEADPALRVTGLLAHQLSHCVSPAVFGAHLRNVADCLARTQRDTGIRFPVLDVGGGFESRLLLAARGVTADDFAVEAAAALAALPYPVTVYLEPGRYVAADAAVGLTRVVARKARTGADWLITDLGTNSLIPVPGARFPVIPVHGADGDRTPARIADRTCAPAVIDAHAALPAGADTLAVLNAGAYTVALSHIWGPELPRVVSLDHGADRTLTDADSYRRAFTHLYGYSALRPKTPAAPLS